MKQLSSAIKFAAAAALLIAAMYLNWPGVAFLTILALIFV